MRALASVWYVTAFFRVPVIAGGCGGVARAEAGVERVGIGTDFVGGGAPHFRFWLRGRVQMGSGMESEIGLE